MHFSSFLEKVLSELNLTIVSKCEHYNDNATRYLFRLNNIYYILKSLQRSNTLDLLILTEPDCERHYLELIQVLNLRKKIIKRKLLKSLIEFF